MKISLLKTIYFISVSIIFSSCTNSISSDSKINKTVETDSLNYNKGDTINILDSLDFSDGNWKLYITAPYAYMNYNDTSFVNQMDSSFGKDYSTEVFNSLTYDLYTENFKNFCVSTTNINELNELKKISSFKIKGGYMSTAYLQIYFLKNNKLILQIELLAEKNNVGINHQKYGYMKAINDDKLISFIKKLKPDNFENFKNSEVE